MEKRKYSKSLTFRPGALAARFQTDNRRTGRSLQESSSIATSTLFTEGPCPAAPDPGGAWLTAGADGSDEGGVEFSGDGRRAALRSLAAAGAFGGLKMSQQRTELKCQ